MPQIQYINRKTKAVELEKVYGENWISLFYGNSFFSKTLGKILLFLCCRFSFISRFYGFLQKLSWSQRKVIPFIQRFDIDFSEFEKSPDCFTSFNDFFIRKLKKEARPIVSGERIAAMPADGRYLAFNQIDELSTFFVKNRAFNLKNFLNSEILAKKYSKGSVIMARLCPLDYHRFHFSVSGVPRETKLINGAYFSVNPLALKQNLEFLTQNKRFITLVESEIFGDVLHIEVGATNVGSVIQTHKPWKFTKKGVEKGFFQFGGSMCLIFFEQGVISLDKDIVENTQKGKETLCQCGESMGTALLA